MNVNIIGHPCHKMLQNRLQRQQQDICDDDYDDMESNDDVLFVAPSSTDDNNDDDMTMLRSQQRIEAAKQTCRSRRNCAFAVLLVYAILIISYLRKHD
jgi:hypothetical protein